MAVLDGHGLGQSLPELGAKVRRHRRQEDDRRRQPPLVFTRIPLDLTPTGPKFAKKSLDSSLDHGEVLGMYVCIIGSLK